MRALRLDLAMAMKSRAGRGVGLSLLAFRLARLVDAAHQRLQQLACVLEIAAPQQTDAFRSQTERGIGGHRVVRDHHAFGCGSAVFGMPACRRRFLAFG